MFRCRQVGIVLQQTRLSFAFRQVQTFFRLLVKERTTWMMHSKGSFQLQRNYSYYLSNGSPLGKLGQFETETFFNRVPNTTAFQSANVQSLPRRIAAVKYQKDGRTSTYLLLLQLQLHLLTVYQYLLCKRKKGIFFIQS